MKTLSLLCLGALIASLPLNVSSASMGPVWRGPQKPVEWRGLEIAALALKSAGVEKTAEAEDSGVPQWVGYVKRSNADWWFRLILADGRSEMVRRGGSTSDGWSLINMEADANRPRSITLSKDGVEKILKLTPQ